MTTELLRKLRGLQGRNVSLCLVDGSRLDDVALVSVRTRTIWVFTNGEDTFVRVADVRDWWEAGLVRRAA